MQMNLMRGHEQPRLYSDIDYSKQASEISQINQVKETLNQLMHKASGHQTTSIMNPSVQKNLNDFIKTQRDENVRMSQSISFKDEQHERVDAFD